MTWRVQFDWFVDFCGLENDGEALGAFMSTTRLKHSAHLAELQDEEAPVSTCHCYPVCWYYISVLACTSNFP